MGLILKPWRFIPEQRRFILQPWKLIVVHPTTELILHPWDLTPVPLRLRQSLWANPGVVGSQPGAMNTHLGAVDNHPLAIEANPRAIEALSCPSQLPAIPGSLLCPFPFVLSSMSLSVYMSYPNSILYTISFVLFHYIYVLNYWCVHCAAMV